MSETACATPSHPSKHLIFPNPAAPSDALQLPCDASLICDASEREISIESNMAPRNAGLYFVQCPEGRISRLVVR
jgi:hypothetical protein